MLVPLARTLNMVGTAIAFLVANTLLLPIALKHLPTTAKSVATPWGIHIATALLSYVSPAGEVATAIVLSIASIIAIHSAKIVTVNEVCNTLKTVINTLFGNSVEKCS